MGSADTLDEQRVGFCEGSEYRKLTVAPLGAFVAAAAVAAAGAGAWWGAVIPEAVFEVIVSNEMNPMQGSSCNMFNNSLGGL